VMMNGHPHQLLSDEAVLLKYKGSAPPTLSSVACVRDHVLIKPTKKDEMSASGIIVRTTASQQDEENQRPDTGVVVQMGPGVQNKKTGVVEEIRGFGVGDSVMFRQYTTNPVKLDGQDYVIVRAVNILSKLTPAKK
jgi:chaperonin GroES